MSFALSLLNKDQEKVNSENNAELLDMDVEGAYRALINERGLNSFEALQAIKKKVLSRMGEDPRFNLDSEDLEEINKNLSPNEVLLRFTNIRDRGRIESFLEGGIQSAAVNTPAFATALGTGLAVGKGIAKAPIPVPPMIKIPAAVLGGIAAGVYTLSPVAAVMQGVWNKATKDTPFENQPFLPEDYAYREAGKTVGAFLGGGAAVRPLLKRIPEEGSEFFVKRNNGGIEKTAEAINPIKEGFRKRFVGAVRRGADRINPFDGTFWKRLTSNIGRSARDTTTKTRIGLTPYATAEVQAAAGAGLAAGAAETAYPGELLPRILAETVGGFLPATIPLAKTAYELGKDFFSSIEYAIPEKIFGVSTGQRVQQAKDRRVGKTLLEMMRKSFDEKGEVFDYEKFAASVRAKFSPEEISKYNSDQRSMGFLTNNDAIIALQNKFAQQSPEFKDVLTKEIQDQTELITAVTGALYETGNREAIEAATNLFSTSFGNRIESALNQAVTDIDPAVRSLGKQVKGFEDRAAASETLRKGILEVYEAANNVVDGLWAKVDRTAASIPRNSGEAIERAFKPGTGGINRSRRIFTDGPKEGEWNPKSFSDDSIVPILNRIAEANAGARYKNWADLTPEEKIKFKGQPNVNKGTGGPRRIRVDAGENPMTINEMKNDRTTLMAVANKTPPGPDQALMYSLAEGLLEDMMDGVARGSRANKVAFEQARGASKVMRDIFDRTFAKTVINQDEPMLLRLNTALGFGKDKGRIVFEELEDASNILFNLAEEFGAKALGKTTVGGAQKTLEDLGEFANASVESVAAGLLGQIFKDKKVFKIKEVQIPGLPGQPRRTEAVEVVDTEALKKVLEDPMIDRILGFDAFKSLREELKTADDATITLLKEALPELKNTASEGAANIRVLSSVLNTDNPQHQINNVLNSSDPRKQFTALAKMVAEAEKLQPDSGIKDGFMSILVDTILTRAAVGETTSNLSGTGPSFKKFFEEPIEAFKDVGKAPIGDLTDPTSIKTILLENNLLDQSYVDNLEMLYKGFDDLMQYSTKVVDPAPTDTNEGARFVASLIGAASAPKTQTGQIAIPSAAARAARSALNDVPQILLYARLKELLSPGKSEEFLAALKLGADDFGKADSRETIARQLANYLYSASSAPFKAMAREIAAPVRPERKPQRPERKPQRPERKPPVETSNLIPPRPERKPPVETSDLIPPRPPITPPPSNQVSELDLSGPFNPETYALLFPNDGVA